MPLYETECLVLKSYNLSEADRIIVLFSREFGIVRGVAKGAKRLNSKFGSTLELFSTAQVAYFQRDEVDLVSIQHVELIKSHFEKVSNPDFLPTFAYFADLLTSFLPPHDPNEKLYRMVSACLEVTSEVASLAAVRLYFEIWLLRFAGYLPHWDKCGSCLRVLGEAEAGFLQHNYLLFCLRCGAGKRNEAILGTHREVFHCVQKVAPADFLTFSESRSGLINDLSVIFKTQLSQVVGHSVGEINIPVIGTSQLESYK